MSATSSGNGTSGNSGNAGQGQSTSTGTGNTSTGTGNTSTGTSSATSASTSVGTSGSASTSTSTNTSNESENATSTTTTNASPSYNKQGVDANGLTKSGKQGDRNGDGKISAGESFVNNVGNWTYDVGQKANSFFGGADSEGNTKAGRAADRNGDGKVSLGERIGNMFNNLGTNINQTFGGVNYQGKNKSGEQVVAPGEHVNFNQRMTNLGHNFLSRNGKSWSDTNNNGIMDGNELGRAAAINATTFGLNLVPVFGKALSDFAAKTAAGESNNIAGQSDTSYGGSGTTYTSYTGPSQGPGSSTLAPLKEKVEPEKVNNNFIKRVKRLDISSLPAVTSTYIKRGEEKAPAITVSDEELKSFALRFYRQKTIK